HTHHTTTHTPQHPPTHTPTHTNAILSSHSSPVHLPYRDHQSLHTQLLISKGILNALRLLQTHIHTNGCRYTYTSTRAHTRTPTHTPTHTRSQKPTTPPSPTPACWLG